MIKDKSLKFIFIVSLITAITFPLVSILYIHPSFSRMLLHHTEDEALRTGNYLAQVLLGEDSALTGASISGRFLNQAGSLLTSFNIMKIKVFAPTGETLYSTDSIDTGKANTQAYFHEIVAKGRPFSKVVKKHSKSLEDQVVISDVVETYVPIMRNGKFAGAFELYYDITERIEELNRKVFFSSVIPLALMFVFLTVIIIALVRADSNRESSAMKGNTLRYKSPFYSMAIITGAIFISELAALAFVRGMPDLSRSEGAVLDMILMIMFIAPTLYFFFVQPLVSHVHERNRINNELVRKHNELNALFREVEIANKERQKTMDAVGDMIILADDEGIIRRVNRAVSGFTQKSCEEILGIHWEEIIDKSGLEATAFFIDSTELRQAGTDKWFLLSSYPFKDNDLKFSGSVIALHETTELKRISNELEQTNREIDANRNKLQSALDQITALIDGVIQSKDHFIRFENPCLKKCYEVKGCGKTDCPCYGVEAMRCWKVAGTYCGGTVQGAFAQKYGNCSACEVYREATTDPIYQIGEHFNNMMHILETKSIELEQAYENLKATQSQMLQREKMASIGQLAAGVAHEINNPMGFISSNLGSLGKYAHKLKDYINIQKKTLESLSLNKEVYELENRRRELKIDFILEDIDHLIDESLEGAERVKKIVQNLKTFSRVDEAEYKAADINECIESTLNIVWNELKYKSTVEKEYGELPLIKCFPQQINQVIMNLLVNAAQAIEKQGTIRIRTWNGDGSIHISVSDTGCGIPEETAGRIFEPFFTTKPVGKGTGLGLSIAYEIVKKHNGDITVESEAGKGTTFTVHVPLAEE